MGTDTEQPRFLFPRGKACHIYNLPVLRMLRPGEDLYISEGASDAWSLLSSGRKAIAIPASTLFNDKEFKCELLKANIIGGKNRLHIYPDRDEPREKLYEEILTATTDLGIELIRHDLPQSCKDFSDYWQAEALTVKR